MNTHKPGEATAERSAASPSEEVGSLRSRGDSHPTSSTYRLANERLRGAW